MSAFTTRPAFVVLLAAATAVGGFAIEASARQTVGVVQGVVVDEKGAPLRGAEITARYQSNPGGASISSKSALTDADGRYTIDIRQPVGTWSIHGSVMVDGIQVDLLRDNDALFAGNVGAIRNLRVQYVEQSADSSYGTGGIVLIDRAIGEWPDFTGMQVTLRPVDGGPAITRTIRNTGEGWVVTGFKPGSYVVTASTNGAPWLLTAHGGSNWSTSYTGRFVNSGTKQRHMLLMAKAAPPGTQPPPGGNPPPPQETPPEGGEWGTPTNVPVDQRWFGLAKTVQTVGTWSVKPSHIQFKGAGDKSTPNQVRVWMTVTNLSPLKQEVVPSFRFGLNVSPGTLPSSQVDGGSYGTIASIKLAEGESREIAVTFPVAQHQQTGIRSMRVTTIAPPMLKLLGRERDAGTIEIPLPRRPASDAPPPSQQGQTPTDQKPAPQPAPSSETPPQPRPSGPPVPPQPVVAGDVRIIGPIATAGEWSLEVTSLSHRDGAAGGTTETTVYADLTNHSRMPTRLQGGGVTALLRSKSGGASTTGWEAYINSVKQPWDSGFMVAAGQTVKLVARYSPAAELQRSTRAWDVTITGEKPGKFELALPPRDAAFVPYTPIYVGPLDPSPTPASAVEMRALEGKFIVANIGEMTLRYEGGLLLGETQTQTGQPLSDVIKFAMPASGKLQGTLHRPNDPPSRAWYTLDLTVSQDGSRLQGDMNFAHPPINTPRPFVATRSAPAPAPVPAIDPVVTNATGGFQPTAYLEMKVDRVTRTATGAVEVTLTARHAGEVRRGVQQDPQRFRLIGSDGAEYANDGNYYGASGAERMSNTLYLLGGAEGKVTYVFRTVPAQVAPVRLVLRQDGQQTASFDLPKGGR